MKKLFILLIIIFCVSSISSTKAHTNTDSLEKIISYSNSQIVKKEIFSYGYFSSNLDIKILLDKFISKNFNNKEFTIKENSLNIYGVYKDNKESINVTISKVEGSSENTYISIFYSHNDSEKNIINLRDNILQMITPFDSNAKIYTQIVGKVNNKLSNNEISSLISSMLLNTSDNFKKDYDDSSVSFSGYTKNLKNLLQIENRKVNIQASGKYSSSDKCTYIWVGHPIISTEY